MVHFPNIFRAVRCTALVSGSLSLGMVGFDLLSLGPDNALTVWNARLHANPWYNFTWFAVAALSVFTGSAYRTMKPKERVLSTDPETGELLEKQVPETYVRRASRLVCLRVGGEILRTTPGHPFYVTGRGFVRAGDLKAGERLCDIAGNAILLEEVRFEILEKPVRVYNFQVADFHTYHVGRAGVLVHNAGNGYGEGDSETDHMLGEAGTQVRGSKTTGQNGKTERVDVENPAQGRRPGDVHYHDSNNTKWRYDTNSGKLVDPTTGELAPPKVQKISEASWFQKAIDKSIDILGE